LDCRELCLAAGAIERLKCDNGHRSHSRLLLAIFDSGESGIVVAAIVWKDISTAFEGRPIGGSWIIENGIVKVKTTLGEKTAPLEEANGIWIAWRLLRELAAEGKA
jgi:hypothetical protein